MGCLDFMLAKVDATGNALWSKFFLATAPMT